MFVFAPQEQNVYSFLTTKHRAPTERHVLMRRCYRHVTPTE